MICCSFLAVVIAGVTIICERVYALWNVLRQVRGVQESGPSAPSRAGICPRAMLLRDLERSLGHCVWPRPARIRQNAAQTTEAVMPQRTSPLGRSSATCGHSGPWGPPRPCRVRTVVGILKSLPVHVDGGHGWLQGRVAGDRGRMWDGGRLPWSPSTHYAYKLVVSRVGAIAGRVQGFLRGFSLCGEYARTREVPPQWPVRGATAAKKTPRPRRIHHGDDHPDRRRQRGRTARPT